MDIRVTLIEAGLVGTNMTAERVPVASNLNRKSRVRCSQPRISPSASGAC